jgi:flagellin
MVINTNTSAMSSARLLSNSSVLLSKSLAKLSSGSRIISPDDDAAGLAVSMHFDAQINRIGAAGSNVANATSFNQTQDGFLQKVGKALDRMSELATLSQDVTKTSSDLGQYQLEFAKLTDYIADLSTKDYNGVSLFDGTTLNVTIDSDANTVAIAGADLTDAKYDLSAKSVSTDAKGALTAVKSAIDQLATDRSRVGANISVLNSYHDQLGVLKDNLVAANSRIKDVDVAEESTNFARYNILVQAGTAMLAQANASTQSALRLLQ